MTRVSKLEPKMAKLRSVLSRYRGLAVAFSGGVDSSFLLAMACRIMGEHVLAVTAESAVHPQRERGTAAEFAKSLGVRHIIVSSGEMNLPDFVANPRDRCYICKRHVLKKIITIASKGGILHVAHGANVDDLGDYRPGYKAAQELGVVAPLVDAGFTKNDIRQCSREMNLTTWDKPSMACLASRIPYGTPITHGALEMIEQAEDYILSLGFKTCRVRHHGNIARIELGSRDIQLMLNEDLRQNIVNRLREIGFFYVTVDLEGYVQGSMNIQLD